MIYVVATGGTIAGVADDSTSSIYKSGILTADELIAQVPGIAKLADIKSIQLFNKNSSNLLISDWLILNTEINTLLDNPDVDGVVITHGTDTLEETAYFLNLTIKSNKPVVMVGSMRPATALSNDGPLNLYNAVAVAANKQSWDRGVLVAMNEQIFDARDVTKTNTTSVQTFNSPNTGKIGAVLMGTVRYYLNIERKHTTHTPFNIINVNQLPKVIILYQHVDVDQQMLFNILQDKTIQGIVIAGAGGGSIPDYEATFIKQATLQGIVIARSSRVASGYHIPNHDNLDTIYGTIHADNLNPQKARILLMLALTLTDNPSKIEEYFTLY